MLPNNANQYERSSKWSPHESVDNRVDTDEGDWRSVWSTWRGVGILFFCVFFCIKCARANDWHCKLYFLCGFSPICVLVQLPQNWTFLHALLLDFIVFTFFFLFCAVLLLFYVSLSGMFVSLAIKLIWFDISVTSLCALLLLNIGQYYTFCGANRIDQSIIFVMLLKLLSHDLVKQQSELRSESASRIPQCTTVCCTLSTD